MNEDNIIQAVVTLQGDVTEMKQTLATLVGRSDTQTHLLEGIKMKLAMA